MYTGVFKNIFPALSLTEGLGYTLLLYFPLESRILDQNWLRNRGFPAGAPSHSLGGISPLAPCGAHHFERIASFTGFRKKSSVWVHIVSVLVGFTTGMLLFEKIISVVNSKGELPWERGIVEYRILFLAKMF
jgi:hypothetical protein